MVLRQTSHATMHPPLRKTGQYRCFLHENITAFAVFKCKQHQIDRLVQRHDKARHRRIGNGDRLAGTNLLDPQRNDRAAAAHHVAVTGAADLGFFG